jgi:hypothetical protein
MLRAIACCCALLALTPRAAAAEWHLTPMVGITFAGNTSFLDFEDATDKVHRQFGGAVALLGRGILGAETIVVYTPGFFGTGDLSLAPDNRSFAWVGNVVLTAPQRWTEYGLRPFVSGGLGLLRPSIGGAFPFSANVTGYDVGGGAVGFFSKRVGIRFDLRYYSSVRRTDLGPIAIGPAHLRYMTGSVGIVFRRGASTR